MANEKRKRNCLRVSFSFSCTVRPELFGFYETKQRQFFVIGFRNYEKLPQFRFRFLFAVKNGLS